ncbi:hypothetical protein PQG02_20700 [Nostoc sp. UHCC 0926]|uniref:hypothetical protein n=1 Tax=unclassified Nostoc TaxID=2593658 RepID=UPI002362F418|nr:hypothetical protein [Nostoc sp. UHCC 0926]WDD31137.1 hypothetical protein PQG02_20700 [Nostoc sp. UHCC 0926]
MRKNLPLKLERETLLQLALEQLADIIVEQAIASYHRSDEVKKFLASVNERASFKAEWQIPCIRFAPNAPEKTQ